jgi:hypothetical protein
MKRSTATLLAALVVAVIVWLPLDARHDGQASAASCHGRVEHVVLSRSKYPHIVDHVEDSWALGYPRVLRVHRAGATERRARLLGWWQRKHPQPKGDGLDLDEAPAAMLRVSWRADVRPIAAAENRSAGASLGGQLRGVPDGTCVDYRFTGRAT